MAKKMRSSYEAALARRGLDDTSKPPALSDKQKRELAEIERIHKAKIAERKIMAENEIHSLTQRGNLEEAAKAREELSKNIRELEEQKSRQLEKVRNRAN